jgi:cytochrome c peroxidase
VAASPVRRSLTGLLAAKPLGSRFRSLRQGEAFGVRAIPSLLPCRRFSRALSAPREAGMPRRIPMPRPHPMSTLRTVINLKRFLLSAFLGLVVTGFLSQVTGGQNKPQIQLGARLFSDERFSNPNGDFSASCSHCHILNENAQGMRVYTDFLARSWVPWRLEDPKRDALRNAPTIFDSGEMPLLHFDGEFASLEDLVRGTLTGRSLGWLPGEERKARERIYRILSGESSYRDQFKEAYGQSLDTLDPGRTLDLVARALSDYMRSLKTRRTAPYDRFIERNGLASAPEQAEAAPAFARRLLGQIRELEKEKRLSLPVGFGPDALKGMKMFFSAGAPGSAGNCAACHVPPLFTDFSFHNTGISQVEYDKAHGDGSFARLRIPDAASAARPSSQFRETPSPSRPGSVDLGYWNFAKLSGSPLRRPGETDDAFLRRMIAAFKTPTLRNLAFSEPYMHNGAYPTLESAISELMRLSGMARAGRIRESDPELTRIKISTADVAPLIAFLNSLNEDWNSAYHR